MQGRNINKGRHSIGAPIAKSGTKPKARTGSADRLSPGARTNKGNRPITSATLMQRGKSTPNNQNYQANAAAMIKQSPEPFRSDNPASRPDVPKTFDSGASTTNGQSGKYTNYHGVEASSAIPTSKPKTNPGGVGIQGRGPNSGMGSNNRLVVAGNTPKTRRAGSPFSIGVKSARFYGR